MLNLGGALKYFFSGNWFLSGQWFGTKMLWNNIIMLFLETSGSDLKVWKGDSLEKIQYLMSFFTYGCFLGGVRKGSERWSGICCIFGICFFGFLTFDDVSSELPAVAIQRTGYFPIFTGKQKCYG